MTKNQCKKHKKQANSSDILSVQIFYQFRRQYGTQLHMDIQLKLADYENGPFYQYSSTEPKNVLCHMSSSVGA